VIRLKPHEAADIALTIEDDAWSSIRAVAASKLERKSISIAINGDPLHDALKRAAADAVVAVNSIGRCSEAEKQRRAAVWTHAKLRHALYCLTGHDIGEWRP
jgi:hypothetical protein